MSVFALLSQIYRLLADADRETIREALARRDVAGPARDILRVLGKNVRTNKRRNGAVPSDLSALDRAADVPITNREVGGSRLSFLLVQPRRRQCGGR